MMRKLALEPQNGSKMSLFEHSWSPKGSKISQNVSNIDLFEHFWSPWAPQNSSFSVCFQVGKPIFLRFGCDFRSKSHEISRKTRGFSLFETGETLYFTCPNAVFVFFFSCLTINFLAHPVFFFCGGINY